VVDSSFFKKRKKTGLIQGSPESVRNSNLVKQEKEIAWMNAQ